MRKMTGWLAALLCMLLAVGPAFAEGPLTLEDANNAGREATCDISFEWHNPLLLDAETNKLIASTLASIGFETTSAMVDESTAYSSFAMTVSGQDAVTGDVIITKDGMYMGSSMQDGYEAIEVGDFATYYANYGAYLDTMMQEMEVSGDVDMDMPEGFYKAMMTQVGASVDQMIAEGGMSATAQTTIPQPTEEDVDEIIDTVGLRETMDSFQKWIETEMQGEAYTGQIGTVYGPEMTHATVYALTPENLSSLVDAFLVPLAQSETYWTFIASMVPQDSLPEGETIDAQMLMDTVPMMRDELQAAIKEMPEDVVMRLNTCYDDAGELALTQIEFIVPGDEYGYGEVSAYVEWQPQGLPVYAEFMIEGDGFTLDITGNDPVLDMEDTGFTAMMTIYSYGEAMGQVAVQTSSVTNEDESGRVWEGSFMAGVLTETDEMVLEVLANQVDTYQGEDVTQAMTVDLNLYMGETPLPVMTMYVNTRTGEAQGLPFDVNAVDMIYPGQMTEDEFAVYMQEKMAASIQTGFAILSMLPQDVFMAIFSPEMMGMQ